MKIKYEPGIYILSMTNRVHITGPNKSNMGAVTVCGRCYPENVYKEAPTKDELVGTDCIACFRPKKTSPEGVASPSTSVPS